MHLIDLDGESKIKECQPFSLSLIVFWRTEGFFFYDIRRKQLSSDECLTRFAHLIINLLFKETEITIFLSAIGIFEKAVLTIFSNHGLGILKAYLFWRGKRSQMKS